MLGVFTFVVALFVSTALIPPLTYVSGYLGLVDIPSARKLHAGAVPRIGGLAIIVGALVPILMWVPLRDDVRAYLLGIVILAIFGVWDDRKNIDYRLKFLGQFLAVAVLVFYGGVVFERFPWIETGVLPGYIAIPFTLLLLVGITNAVNLSDGLDGLAGGITLLAVACLALLAYVAEDDAIALTSLAVIGATLGFLRFNTFPARIFMGDTGGQFLGFTTGFLAVVVPNVSNRALSPVVPLLILGLPILDTLSVVVRRLIQGRSPFSPDRNHIHHKLLKMGFSHYEVVMAIYTVQATLVSTAFLLSYSWDELILGLYLVFCVSVVVFLEMVPEGYWSPGKRRGLHGWVGRTLEWLRETGLLSKGPYRILRMAVPGFLVAGALFTGQVPVDFAYLSLFLLAVLLAVFSIKAIPESQIERLCTYVTVSFVSYLVETSVAVDSGCSGCLHAFFGVLAVLIAVWVRFTQHRVFRISGLDFLIVFIAVVVPNIPGFLHPDNVIGSVVIESIILFYAAEILLSQQARRWDMLRVSVLGTLAILGFRGLIG